ncbi:MAG: hypothetical protein HC913_22770 [Microscillaceae bacterium]|nr:hypothetical protein [Microscillaceae bacterium]
MLTQLTITVAEDEAALLRQILENLKMVRHLSDNSPRYYYDPHQGDYSFQDMLDIVARFPADYPWTAADLENPHFFPPRQHIQN